MSNYEESELTLISSSDEKRGGFRDIKSMKPSDDCVVRILPPFSAGPNPHGGCPDKKWALHWLFTGEKWYPIACSYDKEHSCPFCDVAFSYKNEYDALMKTAIERFGAKEGAYGPTLNWDNTPKDVASQLKELMSNYEKHRRQINYYFNAYSENTMPSTKKGQQVEPYTVAVLRVPLTVRDSIIQLLRTAQQPMPKGYDLKNPLSLNNGVSFRITRTQKGTDPRNVKYNVEFAKKVENINGRPVEVPSIGPVPDSIGANFQNLAYDIHNLYTERSAAELRKIQEGDLTLLKSSNGNDRNSSNSFKVEGEATFTPSTATAPAPATPAPATPAPAAPVARPAPAAAPSVAAGLDSDIADLARELGS